MSAERDKRLDQLVTATTEWGNKRTVYLNNQVTTLKAIMKGRTGSERLANSSVQKANDLVVNQINSFLAS